MGPQEGTKTNWMRVKTTEEKEEDDHDPLFAKISINMFHLCGGNKSLPLRFSLYSKQPNDKALLYGRAEVTIKELENNPEKERDLINEKGRPKLGGFIEFPEFTIQE